MEGEAIFNIAGVPNEEFLEEVTDSQQVKKNAIFFALLTDGVAGDPGFGVGLSALTGEPDTERTAVELDARAADTLPVLVVDRIPAEQMMAADLRFTDLDSNKNVVVPLMLSGA